MHDMARTILSGICAQCGITFDYPLDRSQSRRYCSVTCAVKQNPLTHGHVINGKATPEYSAWQSMKRRCLNPRDHAYRYYGARGITICARWLASVVNFLTDMGPKPSPLHSLERRDNSLGYSPENCYWATSLEQMQNTRWNQYLTYNGETRCYSEWARRFGLNLNTLRGRLQHGWTVEEALKGRAKAPSKAKHITPRKRYQFEGHLLYVSQIARLADMSERTLHNRLKRTNGNADEAVFAYVDGRATRWNHSAPTSA